MAGLASRARGGASAGSWLGLAAAAALAAGASGCSGDKGTATDPPQCTAATPCGTLARMDFTGQSGFYGAPFPSDARLRPDGTPDTTGFPTDSGNALATQILALLASHVHGFSLTSAAYFGLTGPVVTTGLDDPHASLAAGASVFLVDVDPKSPAFGKRSPVSVGFLADGGPFGDANLLAVLPYQGIPLLPATRYATVVRTTLKAQDGSPLGVAPEMAQLAAGTPPAGMSAAAFASYTAALGALAKLGVAASEVAALTVFTTDTPTEQLGKVRSAMLARPLPKVSKPFVRHEVFPTFCVYETTLPMPEYQGGEPPYQSSGGGWVFDAAGEPVFQREEEANIVVTVPRAPMPDAGYPMAVLSRTGAGGNRPLVDRGRQVTAAYTEATPGTGPALYFAAAGYAGASVDGPLGGLRNPTNANEDFTIFNVGNPAALLDNVRQSAAELTLVANLLAALELDAGDCPGVSTKNHGPVHFDGSIMALMGHSMGSTIAPLSLAFEPRYRAGILSGAGGSWIDNIIYKQSPVPVKGLVELLLGLAGTGYGLSVNDPLLNLFQWAVESADLPVYASRIAHQPVDGPARNVLMVQGIVDTYILPPMANATSLSFGLDLASPSLDAASPALASMTPLRDLLDLSGRKAIATPVAGNVTATGGQAVTAVVVQHPSDGLEDGHEVIFQTEAPKHQYLCFLKSLAAGQTPRIPADAAALAPCE